MLSRIFTFFLYALAAIAVVLMLFRYQHNREIGETWESLRKSGETGVFALADLEGLPEPAQRYLRHAIKPGTPLAGYVELTMEGSIALSRGAEPYPLQAKQILSPSGLIWQASAGRGWFQLSGDDSYVNGHGSMRWYLWGLAPVVRADGPNISKSAAGRVALELPLWLPSALLPKAGARWEAVDENSARVHLTINGEELAPLLTVDSEGRLQRVEMMRWDTQGLAGKPGYVPWVGETLGEEATFDGYTVPTQVRATAKAGTPQANPFYNAQIIEARFH